jgi:hypothetical protein
MQKIIPIVFSAFALMTILSSQAFSQSAEDIAKHQSAYHAAGKSLVNMALSKKVDTAEASKQVDKLLEAGKWLAEAYAQKFPQSAKLLKIVTDNIAEMKKLSFQDLEHQWHDLHYFSNKKEAIGVDLADENNEHFTDPIHVIVHPLLVLKAAQSFASGGGGDAALQQMKEEMEEGIEQIDKALVTMQKK